jgi:tight adherence protein B
MLIILIFLAIFTAVVLLLFAFSMQSTKEAKKTLSRLDAIRLGPQSPVNEEHPLIVRRQEVLSRLRWLDKWLQKRDVAPKLRLLLYQAEVPWTAGRVVSTSLLAGLVCGYLVYWRTGSAILSLFLSAVAGAIPFLYILRKRNQRFHRMRQRLPDALDLMVSAIRAGHSFSSALGMASRESQEPIKREFRQSFDEQNFGLELRVAMTNLAYRVPIRDIRMIVTAVIIQKETGGNLTEILEKVAHLIREDFRLQRQVAVHTAQGRMTGGILSCLPVILGIGLYLVNPEHMSLLWRRPAGAHMLEGAIVMMVIGMLIIRRIVRIQI